MAPPRVRHISRCAVKPRQNSEAEPPQPWYLTPCDLAMLSVHYIQKGLLFSKPLSTPPDSIIHHLKDSLSSVLFHFFPLAGRLVTKKDDDPLSPLPYLVSVDSTDDGAEFIHAYADHLTIADILNALDVPDIVKSFFPYNFAVNHDAHTIPLLAVQVTELVDGIFVGCSFNHAVGDGTSFWHFFNAWAEVSRTRGEMQNVISRPPLLDRWFLEGKPSIVGLPFAHQDEFVVRFAPLPHLRERIFHFSSQSVAQLKKKANRENNTDRISSFQALSAHMWRSMTRARRLSADRMTSCRLAINNRSRLNPPLSPYYFGNFSQPLNASSVTVGELLSHDLGWAAWLLHQSVVGQTDGMVRGFLEAWYKAPFVYNLGHFDPYSVMIGSSPRFDMYGNDFCWGKAIGICSGPANKFDGKISSYPGVEGGGSIDMEVCLPHETMSALESDEDFMNAVS